MDTSQINLIDLIGQKVSLKRVTSREYAGPCPWCGGTDRFRVWPYDDRPHYWCRQCGRHGDSIQYLRDRNELSFGQACAALGLSETQDWTRRRLATQAPPRPNASLGGKAWTALKDPQWQHAAYDFVRRSRDILHGPEGAEGRDYLHGRGLTDAVIEEAVLGYNPTHQYMRWGTERVELLRGITIPWTEHIRGQNNSGAYEERLWKVNVRRLDGLTPKYKMATGSANGLYGITRLHAGDTVVMVEGEFCALSLRVAVPDSIIPIATGSATGSHLHRWIARLALASQLLLAFDDDEPGEQAAAWWKEAFPNKAVRLIPLRHDVNDMLTAGDDIPSWLKSVLK